MKAGLLLFMENWKVYMIWGVYASIGLSILIFLIYSTLTSTINSSSYLMGFINCAFDSDKGIIIPFFTCMPFQSSILS